MAYKDFTLDELEAKLGTKNIVKRLFTNDIAQITPSNFLQTAIATAEQLPVRSEKAKSEAIVFPILVELRNINDNFLTIYSGDKLNVDKALGLIGECDFIISKDTGTFTINYPIIAMVEAKKNDIELGVPQCAAQMVGAMLYNRNKNIEMPKIYGCVTTGDEWLFMCLENNIISIDTKKYYLGELEELLGVLQFIINYYKKLLN